MLGVVEEKPPVDSIPACSCAPQSSVLSRFRVWWPAVLVLGTLLSFPIDLPMARFCRHGGYPKVIGDILNNAEPFGHAAGVAFIVITVWVLDERGRQWGPLLALTATAGGMTADVAKLLVSRTRPRNFSVLPDSVSETFQGWLPLFSHGSAAQSFPSAHTATAVSLAIMLSAAYPRGRWWFATLAVLVGLHRVQSGAHYLSDVFAGAFVGWMVGRLCLAASARWAQTAASSPSRRESEASSRAA
jgi:membrane-associated phospholipid phosphatase